MSEIWDFTRFFQKICSKTDFCLGFQSFLMSGLRITVTKYSAVSCCLKEMDCYEASLLKMKIIEVYGDGNKQLIDQEFYCLKSIQIQQNKYNKTKLKYDIHGCDYSNSYDGVNSLQQLQYPTVGISNEDLYIGRSNSNHIVLSDLSISKQHAIVSYDAHFGCFIKDLNSKHGTYINDDRINIDESVGSRIAVNDLDAHHIREDNLRSDKEHKSDIDDDPTEQHDGSEISSCKNIVNEQRQVLRIGMIVRFGRIVCEVFRKQQNQVLTSGFQPFNNNKPIAHRAVSCLIKSTNHVDAAFMDTTTQHKLAVTQRIQALLTTTHPLPISLFDPTTALSNSRKDRHNSSNTASIKGKRSRNGMSLASKMEEGSNDNNNDNSNNDKHNDNNNHCYNDDRGDKKLSNIYRHVDTCIDITNAADIESINHKHQHSDSVNRLNTKYSDQLHSSTGVDLLTKMGWKNGRAIGKHDVRAPELIIPEQRLERLGIGHASNDVNHHQQQQHQLYMKSSDDSERLKIWKRMIGRYHHHT
jgi:hypothetical protein